MEDKAVAIIVALVALIVVVLLAGCLSQNQVDVEQVRAYADPITENILVAMNEDNYTKYSEHFDATMKNALPEPVFHENNVLIQSKIGAYVSKEYWKVESQNQYTIVYYKATFTQEPDDVIVKVVFQEIAGETKVSGLWLDSPKLREK
jgi:uncharacterized membrane protein